MKFAVTKAYNQTPKPNKIVVNDVVEKLVADCVLIIFVSHRDAFVVIKLLPHLG